MPQSTSAIRAGGAGNSGRRSPDHAARTDGSLKTWSGCSSNTSASAFQNSVEVKVLIVPGCHHAALSNPVVLTGLFGAPQWFCVFSRQLVLIRAPYLNRVKSLGKVCQQTKSPLNADQWTPNGEMRF